MKKLSINDILKMNGASLEKKQMNTVFGGGPKGNNCTLDTITVTPSGSSNDGDDSYAGECSSAKPGAR